jgi:hypothetical protein
MNSLIFRVVILLYTMHILAECERTNSHDFGFRTGELEKFGKMLNQSIKIYNLLSENELNPAQVYKDIESNMGNGFEVVVFDCERPSILEYTILDTNLNHNSEENYVYREVPLTCQQALKDLKENAKCETNHQKKRKRHYWHFEEPFSHATWDLKSKTISKRLIPFDSLFDIFNTLRLCYEYMFMINHPYLLKLYDKFKRPIQCDSNFDGPGR